MQLEKFFWYIPKEFSLMYCFVSYFFFILFFLLVVSAIVRLFAVSVVLDLILIQEMKETDTESSSFHQQNGFVLIISDALLIVNV